MNKGEIRSDSEEIIPEKLAGEEFKDKTLKEILEIKQRNRFTVWDQLGPRARQILNEAPMNKH